MCGWPSNGSLLEAGGASFVNFVKIEDFGGLSVATSHAYWIWDFEKPLNLVGEVDDGQPMAHFWHQEYDFWSSPLKACLPPEGRILCRVCCVLKKNQNAPPRPSELLCYMRSDFLFFNKRGGIRWFLFGHLGPYETISDWPFSLLLFSAFFGAFISTTHPHIEGVQQITTTALSLVDNWCFKLVQRLVERHLPHHWSTTPSFRITYLCTLGNLKLQ